MYKILNRFIFFLNYESVLIITLHSELGIESNAKSQWKILKNTECYYTSKAYIGADSKVTWHYRQK